MCRIERERSSFLVHGPMHGLILAENSVIVVLFVCLFCYVLFLFLMLLFFVCEIFFVFFSKLY